MAQEIKVGGVPILWPIENYEDTFSSLVVNEKQHSEGGKTVEWFIDGERYAWYAPPTPAAPADTWLPAWPGDVKLGVEVLVGLTVESGSVGNITAHVGGAIYEVTYTKPGHSPVKGTVDATKVKVRRHAFAVGDKVAVRDLGCRRGEVVNIHEGAGQGQYDVRLDDGKVYCCRPENVEAAPSDAAKTVNEQLDQARDTIRRLAIKHPPKTKPMPSRDPVADRARQLERQAAPPVKSVCGPFVSVDKMIVDRMFRFLAGLNLQDHPREEQREMLEIVSEYIRVIGRPDGKKEG